MTRKKLLTVLLLFAAWWTADQAAGRSALGWSGSTHAFIAEACLGAAGVPQASYNARMGALVPDFFWYLQDTGRLDPASAEFLHGFDALPDSDSETILVRTMYDALLPWNIGLSFFAKGVKTHVFADSAVHNLFDGYLEGSGMWIDMLQARTGQTNRAALHLALEFSVDALLIQATGSYQLQDLVRSARQATLLEDAVSLIMLDPNPEINAQFDRYLALTRRLEVLAGALGPYLCGGRQAAGLFPDALAALADESIPSKATKGLNDYLSALEILRDYPSEICQTLTLDMHWQTVIQEVIDRWETEEASATRIE